jgi:tripartite-type tricarboxylate transporter receptor subunit TctC
MLTRLTRRSFLATSSLLAAPSIGQAQSALPDRSLRIVVGFPNGGGSDLVARAIAPLLERHTGRRVSVENKPGSTGALAGEALKKAPPDGTIVALLPTTTLSSKALSATWPFDPVTDLAPIMSIGTFQTGIATARSVPVTTLAEYVAWLSDGDAARRRIGLPTTDAILEIYGRMVGRALKVALEGVPFRGAAPMVKDLEESKIPAAYGGVSSFIVPHRGERARLLVCSGPHRLPVLKDVPTTAELGYPGMLMVEWYGLFARAGTPAAIVDAWNKAVASVLADPEVAAQLVQLGVEIDPSTPGQCGARLTAHLAHWRDVLESFGIKPTD